MKHISKLKVEYTILIPIILFGIISVIAIYCTKSMLAAEFQNYWLKQIIWYGIGFILAYSLMFIGNQFLYNNAWWFYIFGILSLTLVLFFGITINNATCWFKIPFIGTIQPSEFMKIFLIIILARIINEFNEKYPNPTTKNEFFFLIKVMILIAIPSALTFIEPDTGAVMIYLIITITMLFISGIRKRWFILGLIIIGGIIGTGAYIYINNQDLFIKIFGTSLFYRIDRITNWSSSSGMQLENSLIAIGSAGILGHGFNQTPIYFPEMQTDFIFTVITSNFGLIGAAILILLIIFFDIVLICTVNKANNYTDKYAIGGIIAVLLFQQIQNISMTIGLLPIMGITLPFISYGGSSLLSYMLLAGIIFNISNENLRFTN